jgi:hypothetical protein
MSMSPQAPPSFTAFPAAPRSDGWAVTLTPCFFIILSRSAFNYAGAAGRDVDIATFGGEAPGAGEPYAFEAPVTSTFLPA